MADEAPGYACKEEIEAGGKKVSLILKKAKDGSPILDVDPNLQNEGWKMVACYSYARKCLEKIDSETQTNESFTFTTSACDVTYKAAGGGKSDSTNSCDFSLNDGKVTFIVSEKEATYVLKGKKGSLERLQQGAEVGYNHTQGDTVLRANYTGSLCSASYVTTIHPKKPGKASAASQAPQVGNAPGRDQ